MGEAGARRWTEQARPVRTRRPRTTRGTSERGGTGRVLVQQWISADGMVVGPDGESDVAPTTLGDAPWGAHAPARVVPDAAGHVRSLYAAGGTGTTIVRGSTTVVRTLLREGLVDDVELFVAPVLVGTGRPLLDPAGPGVRLVLQDAGTWPGGTLRVRYAVAGA